jgi:hypothetical protein
MEQVSRLHEKVLRAKNTVAFSNLNTVGIKTRISLGILLVVLLYETHKR